MAFRILAEEGIQHSVQRIAREQIDRAIEEATDTSVDAAEAVHEVRKRSKQIRGLIRLVRPQLQDAYALENAWYREAARGLASLRDADVLLASLDALLGHFERPLDPQAFAPIRAHLERRREAARDEDAARKRLSEICASMEEGRERIASWRLIDTGFDAIRAGFAKTYADGRDAMRYAYAAPSSEAIHEWRKRVKDHSYHVRLLRCVWDGPMKALRRETETLAEYLGDDHDLTLLRGALLECPDIAESGTLQTVLGLIDRRQVELRASAEMLGTRLYAEKPKAFVRRIERYWHEWRGETSTAAHVAYRPELVTA